MSSGQKSTLVERLDALYEYDREPVNENKLYGWRTFIAMFSSEHIAGTEFVLGTLLVMHGVTAFDVFAGLAVGNLLAVLSWALMCAYSCKGAFDDLLADPQDCRAVFDGCVLRLFCTGTVPAGRFHGECFHYGGLPTPGN